MTGYEIDSDLFVLLPGVAFVAFMYNKIELPCWPTRYLKAKEQEEFPSILTANIGSNNNCHLW